MATTEFLQLSLFSEASGSAVTFTAFRAALAGNTSNMSILDNFASETSASVTTLQAGALTFINASQVSANTYTASSASVGSYATGMLINLKLNVSITGATTLNINELGVVTLKKMNVEGTLSDMASGDLKKNRVYQLRYDGTYFVLISPSTADQVSVAGTALNYVNISASGVMQDSGVPVLSGVTTGSFSKVIVDAYGRVTAGSQVAGISGSRTFYSASATGGAASTLNTITFTDGLITGWTQV